MQYSARPHRALLAAHGLVGSMSRRGNPYDNSKAESFFKTLKVEAVYVADYVLTDYGTGAIMAVPAHDQRDFDFATTFRLPVRQVVRPPDGEVDESVAYVEHAEGREELLARGFDAAVVDKVLALVDRAEWKRRQYPPGPKVSALAFGRDRRLPVTSRWREPKGTVDE